MTQAKNETYPKYVSDMHEFSVQFLNWDSPFLF